MFHQHNYLIRQLKCAKDIIDNTDNSQNYQIVISADKVPRGEHSRRFNAPTVSEVAAIMVGEEFEEHSSL
jgi:hypothetical protein